MEAARWKQIEALMEQALTLPPDERLRFLDDACGADTELRDDVAERLTVHEDAPASFDNRIDSIIEPAGSLKGRHVGHYDVLDMLGGGGMGVVYKAKDTKLGRTVALKFLPPHLSASDEAKERFVQEAKAASALDHTHIATIHEIGEAEDGQLFIAMAFYDGETLKRKIARGPLPVDEALRYAAQIAQGLAKAHAAGIVHRDVKPANVMVTSDGVVKILDFGLAKMADVSLTTTGTRMGTVHYMSPEQARGEEVDHQSDIWSLGVTLYEMLSGVRPFNGDYAQAIIYSVLNQDPTPLTALNSDLPPELEHVVGLCMKKGKTLRYPSMADLLADLEVWTKEKDAEPARRVRTVLVAAMSVLATLLVLLAIAPVRQAVVKTLGLSGMPNQMHLAVLPAMHPDADSLNRVFTDGLVETLTRKLKQLKQSEQFWVESTEEIRRNAITNSTEAWEKFGVNLAITVDATRNEDTVRVTLDLVDAMTQESRKKAEIVRPTAEFAALSHDMVSQLAGMLDVELTPAMHSMLNAGHTTAPEAEHFYTLGLGHLQSFQKIRNIDAAIRLFEQAIQNDSSYALAYAGLGEAYWRKFEATQDVQWARQAEQYCERALELEDLISPAVSITLGLIFAGTNRPGLARIIFELALAKEPTSADAYIGLAKAHQALERFEDAEWAYRQAIDLKPDYWAGWNALGVFYFRLGRYEEAIKPFLQVKDLTPLNARGYNNLGATYFELERKQEAFEMLEEALEVEPHYVGYSNLATVYFHDGNYLKSSDGFEKALELQDTDYRVWGYLGTAYRWTGRAEESKQAYEHAVRLAEDRLELNPNDQEVLGHLANYNAYLGEREKALSYLEILIARDPTDEETPFRIGEAYERLGDREKALVWLGKALEKGYSVPNILNTPDFEALRADERFQHLLHKYRTVASE